MNFVILLTGCSSKKNNITNTLFKLHDLNYLKQFENGSLKSNYENFYSSIKSILDSKYDSLFDYECIFYYWNSQVGVDRYTVYRIYDSTSVGVSFCQNSKTLESITPPKNLVNQILIDSSIIFGKFLVDEIYYTNFYRYFIINKGDSIVYFHVGYSNKLVPQLPINGLTNSYIKDFLKFCKVNENQ